MPNLKFLSNGLLAVFLAVTAIFATNAGRYFRSDRAVDFYQFRLMGQVMARSDADIYQPRSWPRIGEESLREALKGHSSGEVAAAEWRRGRFQAAGTPFLYFFFDLVSTPDYDTDYARFRILSIVLFVFGIVALGWALGIPVIASVFAVLTFSFWFGPFWKDVSLSGNLNLAQIGGLGLLLLFRRGREKVWRNLATGVLLGFAMLIKPNIVYSVVLLFAVWIVLGRSKLAWESGLALGATGVIGVAFSSWFFGSPTIWLDWISTFRFVETLHTNHSLFAAIGSTPSAAAWVVGLVLVTVFMAGVFRRRKAIRRLTGLDQKVALRNFSVETEYLAVAAGLTIYILSGHLVHSHYFLLCIPITLYLVRPTEPRDTFFLQGFKARHLAAIAAVRLMSGEYSMWSYVGTAVAFIAGLFDLWRPANRFSKTEGTARRTPTTTPPLAS